MTVAKRHNKQTFGIKADDVVFYILNYILMRDWEMTIGKCNHIISEWLTKWKDEDEDQVKKVGTKNREKQTTDVNMGDSCYKMWVYKDKSYSKRKRVKYVYIEGIYVEYCTS